MRYLILGNSAAAVAAVDAIRSLDREGAVAMVSPEPFLAYGRPLISYVLEGKTDLAHAGVRDEGWYLNNAVERHFGAGKAAVSLDASEKLVTLEDGTRLPYDKLLVATGSVPTRPAVEGLPDDAPNSFLFNSMEDALAIEAYVDGELARKRAAGSPVRAVVSGSGLIGAKAAEGVASHADAVYLVGHAARPLRKLLDDEAAPMLVEVLERHGVVNVPGTVVASSETDGRGRVVSVTLDDGRELACDMLVTAIGVRPNTALLASAGAEVTRGAVVDECQRTSLPDVYAAGDVANAHNLLSGEDVPLALWPTASEQGRVAGLAMAGDESAVFGGSFARNAVGFFDEIGIVGCGIINPSSDQPDVESVVECDGCTYGKFNVRDGKLVGYLLMNRPDSAGVYTTLIREGIPLDELPDDVFERAPEMLDLPKAFRTRAMLKGYRGEGRA